jgi:hypothetical protein
MASMLDSLLSQVGGNDIAGKLAGMLGGGDAGQVQKAVSAALPAMFGGLARNASQPGGADALDAALDRHDGSLLDGFDGKVDQIDTADGAKIVNHMFGKQQGDVAQQIAGNSGLDLGMVTKLLPMLAPLVMGMLGGAKKSGGLNAGNLAEMLAGEKKAAGGMAGLGGLMGMFDRDGDGNPLNDLAGMLGGGGGGGGAMAGALGGGGGRSGGGGMLGKILGGLFKRR